MQTTDQAREILYNREFKKSINEWIVGEFTESTRQATTAFAGKLSRDFGIDPSLAATAVAREIKNFGKAFHGQIAAKARFNGATMQTVADVSSFSSNSHVKRTWPNFDEIVAAIDTAQRTRQPQHVEITGFTVTIHPDPETV